MATRQELESLVDEQAALMGRLEVELYTLRAAVANAADLALEEDESDEEEEELIARRNGIFAAAAGYAVNRVAARRARKKYESELRKQAAQNARVEAAKKALKD